MKRAQLAVEKRSITGKQVKKMRREGVLPANVYGKDMESTAVQMPIKAFLEVYKEVHETGLVDIEIDGKTFPVLIKNVHINPITRLPLHADFHKVNLKQKITAKIPVVLVGEAKAVVDGLGVLINPISEIEVEALPTDLPENIEINVEGLAELGQQVTVAELKVPEAVTVLSAGDQIVCKIDEIQEVVVEEPAPVEGEEGEKPAEGAEDEKTAEEGQKAEGEKTAEGDDASSSEKSEKSE